MSTYNFYLDGVLLPAPSSFDIEYQPMSTSDSGRLLNGTMVNKGLTKKYKVILYYDNDLGITDEDILVIIGGTWDKFGVNSEESYSFQFTLPGGTTKTIDAYFGPYKLSRGKASEFGEWKGFKLEIIEK
jgi:hypothetical protein